MFTGIIERQGIIKALETGKTKTALTIRVVGNFGRGLKLGESVAVDGVCTTVVARRGQSFTIELMPITLARTRFSLAGVGDRVNLERSLRWGGRMSGHFMMGHVDGAVKVIKAQPDGTALIVTFAIPAGLKKYIAPRGAVAINGVSLTVARVKRSFGTFSLVRYTREHTNLGNLKKGDSVNIEIDVLARYARG